jgi:EAL and modified HD-GYP domain-containing signal transduction protein
VLLGVRPLRKWASLMALSSLRSDKPLELLITCLIRARFCELLGAQAGITDRELDLFLVGLLSTIDALIDRPMESVLAAMRMNDDVKNTLLGKPSPLSDVYKLVVAYERGRWDEVGTLSQQLKLCGESLTKAYRSALTWADEVSKG